MENNIQKLSKQIKNEADLLLKKTKLLSLLKKYGDVFIRGSYELDLMIDGDIDIYVVANNLNKDFAMELLNKLIIKNDFRGYIFYDFVKRRKKGFPKGYYLGLKTRTTSRKWKIDIWLMKSMDRASDQFMKKISKELDDKKRNTILSLKKIIKEKNIDIPSFLIYNAVIENKIYSVKKLIEYSRKNLNEKHRTKNRNK